MPGSYARRVLLLRDPHAAPTLEWQELEQRLPQAERLGDRSTAVTRIEAGQYDLILTDSELPGGGPYGLLGTLIARQHHTTVVVHYRGPGRQRWLKLFEAGAFDLEAEPMSSESFLRWLQEWLGPSVAPPASATVHAA